MANLVVGVMGSADGSFDEGVRLRARRLGRAIAEAGCSLVTGACPGLPHEAVVGAKERSGLVVGVSPALSLAEHVGRYASPVDGYDLLVYTGSGLMGREVFAIRSSDMIVILGGHSGTLGEFAIAYDEGRLIGVLTGTGGIADAISELLPQIGKQTGAVVLFDDDPERLVSRLITYYREQHYLRPSCFTASPARPAQAERRGAETAERTASAAERPVSAGSGGSAWWRATASTTVDGRPHRPSR
jgi:hypothetical protein